MTNDDQDQLVRAVALIDLLRQNVRTAQDSGATVTAKVLGEADGPKVLVGKYKRRKGYRKTIGHRQHYTRIEVLAING